MNKINVNDLNEAVIKFKDIPSLSNYETTDWYGINLEIKRTINFENAMRFVDGVVSIVYDSETGSYTPELKDLGIRKSVIDLYTNVELPTDIEECHEVLYETNLFESVLNLINGRQFNMLVASIEEKLSYITQTNIDIINRKVNELTSVFESFMKNFDGVDIKQLQNALDSLQELGNKASAYVPSEEK